MFVCGFKNRSVRVHIERTDVEKKLTRIFIDLFFVYSAWVEAMKYIIIIILKTKLRMCIRLNKIPTSVAGEYSMK